MEPEQGIPEYWPRIRPDAPAVICGDAVMSDETYAATQIPSFPLGRSGTIREAADAIFWLCSPLSDYVTGQMIPVNGGARRGMS
jgi:NAD(P)-dependent dehydrogenase (short-subunit alcohol dehydrogenase family)